MAKSKSAGLPEELFLAKLIQNVKARDLVSCVGSYYSSSGDGGPKPEYILPVTAGRKLVACCADGAASLERDTGLEKAFRDGLITGNDAEYWSNVPDDPGAIGESVGWAYRQATEKP